MLKKLTPILPVEAIEPCLSFWTERLGFQKVAEVPHGDRLGFVILVKDAVEVMYQSFASLEDDLPGLGWRSGGALYLQVDDLAPIVAAMAGADVVVPPRKTFYGADEIFVREPGGHIVGFAHHPAEG